MRLPRIPPPFARPPAWRRTAARPAEPTRTWTTTRRLPECLLAVLVGADLCLRAAAGLRSSPDRLRAPPAAVPAPVAFGEAGAASAAAAPERTARPAVPEASPPAGTDGETNDGRRVPPSSAGRPLREEHPPRLLGGVTPGWRVEVLREPVVRVGPLPFAGGDLTLVVPVYQLVPAVTDASGRSDEGTFLLEPGFRPQGDTVEEQEQGTLERVLARQRAALRRTGEELRTVLGEIRRLRERARPFVSTPPAASRQREASSATTPDPRWPHGESAPAR